MRSIWNLYVIWIINSFIMLNIQLLSYCGSFLIAAFLFISTHSLCSQDYPLLYQNDFEKGQGILDFEFTDSSAWRLSSSLGNNCLELFGKSNYAASVRSPFNIAVLKSPSVGSFILEVDLKQTGREYGHRDMCLFFGLKDPTNFYYVHLASVADENAHNIFIVNDEPRRNIADKTTEGVAWGNDWKSVKIERDIKEGTIKVYFDDMSQPIMEATDTHFDAGYIGFGSFDDTGMVDNIKLWGEPTKLKAGIFK